MFGTVCMLCASGSCRVGLHQSKPICLSCFVNSCSQLRLRPQYLIQDSIQPLQGAGHTRRGTHQYAEHTQTHTNTHTQHSPNRHSTYTNTNMVPTQTHTRHSHKRTYTALTLPVHTFKVIETVTDALQKTQFTCTAVIHSSRCLVTAERVLSSYNTVCHC